MKLDDAGLILSVHNFPSPSSMVLVFSTCKQNLSSDFFDLDIENPLGRGTGKNELRYWETGERELE